MIPMYEPLQVSKCVKCGKVLAEPKEILRIVKKIMENLCVKGETLIQGAI